MFTGIVQDCGQVAQIRRADNHLQLMIKTNLIRDNNLSLGASVAVNGVCLTIARFLTDGFLADVMPETVTRTNFSELKSGDLVNLELSLAAQDRLDGHFLLGHVDTTAELVKRQVDDNSIRLTFQLEAKYHPYIVEKGSIGLNGISLTVVETTSETFQVALIPYTLAHTTMRNLKMGDAVNVETDILGKYVVNLASESEEIK